MPKRTRDAPIPEELRTLPGRIRSARENRRMSKVALAKQIGADQSTIVRLESGERVIGLQVRMLLRLARALDVSVGWLAAQEGEIGPVAIFEEGRDRRRRESKRDKGGDNKRDRPPNHR